MQLDIFNDSRDVMLRNDLLQALQAHQAGQAEVALKKLRHEYPQDPLLADAHVLLAALRTRASQSAALVAFSQHADLRTQRLNLQDALAPAALCVLDVPAAQAWLRPFWQDLVARSRALPYQIDAEQDHAAWLLLQLQDWQACLDAVERIESWRRIPAPLAWMAQAKLHLLGLPASWSLLAELAWLAPKRLEAVAQSARDPVLQRLKDQFDASFEPDSDSADVTQDLAWFPAWVLTHQPREVAHLSQAQPGQHSAPEQAMRLLVNLLGLERQGRQHDIVAYRKSLRDLNGWLYAQYMKTR